MSGDLLHHERLSRIRAALKREGRVTVSELVRDFGVSEDTVRRDLSELAAEGLCERVYGGAIAVGGATRPFSARLHEDRPEKRMLAEAVARLVVPQSTLFLDVGSTNLMIAAALPEGAGLTVITHAPDIALVLAGRDGIEVRLVGGVFDPHTRACLGADTMAGLAGFKPDLAILGACGLEEGVGVTATRAEDASVKRLVAGAARAVMVAATAAKFAARNPFVVCPPERLTDLVVTATAAPFATFLANAGTRLHLAEPAPAPLSDRLP